MSNLFAIHRSLILASALLLAAAPLHAWAVIIHVPADQPTIQAAIDAAIAGDEVVVAPGVYLESINFQGKAITVRSSGGPQSTIIDANLAERVVTCQSGEGTDTVLEGFTVRKGRVFLYESGAGMLIVRSSPTITNCIFTKNNAIVSHGRGLGRGGAIFNWHGSPTITNCLFLANLAHLGAGIYNYTPPNEAFSTPTITNCVFSGNYATYKGGAICSWGGVVSVTNCSFSGNTAGQAGGAILNSACTATLANCILWGDLPEEIANEDAIAVVSHSDIQGGLPPGTQDAGNNGDIDPLFVDADGADNAAGSMDDNLRLQAPSLCCDSGKNSAIPASAATDLDGNARIVNHHVDMGAYELHESGDCVSTSDCPEADIDCNNIVDGLDIAVIKSSGNWGWPTDSATERFADVNLDGMVNGLDVALATNSACWGL